MSSYEIKHSDCVGLPPGWTKEEVIRKSGLSAGKIDIYYYSPDGKKLRSKPELVREIGPGYDLSCFDFHTGKVNTSALRKSKRLKGSTYDYTRGLRHDLSLVLPIRQTASIFKQPVTVVRTRPESKTRTDLKHGVQEQPRQLFWEKRMQGLQACDISCDVLRTLDLPKNVTSAGPDLSVENMLASIAAALHVNAQPLLGQNATKQAINKNPAIHINTDQPLVQTLSVTDQDIKHQELRVLAARRKLQSAILPSNL